MKKGRRLYWLTLTLAIMLALAYVVHWDLYGRYAAHQESENATEALLRQVDTLERERDKIQRRVQDLDTNPLEIEAAIRSRKRLVRDGETVFRVELPAGPEHDTPPAAPEHAQDAAHP